MEKIEKIKNEALESGLSVIYITEGMNGYPHPEIGYGVIGFDDYAEAEAFASENGADNICLFFKRDGWHHYQIIGSAHDAIDLLSDKMKTDIVFQSSEDAIEYVNEFYNEKFKDFKKQINDTEDDLEKEDIEFEIHDLVKSRDSIINDINKVNFDREFITIDLSRGERFAIESFPNKTMSHWEDSKSYVVGCFFRY